MHAETRETLKHFISTLPQREQEKDGRKAGRLAVYSLKLCENELGLIMKSIKSEVRQGVSGNASNSRHLIVIIKVCQRVCQALGV